MNVEVPGETEAWRRLARLLFGAHWELLTSSRYRAVERRAVRRALHVGAFIGTIGMIVGSTSAIGVEPRRCAAILAINGITILVTLAVGKLVKRRLRRQAIPLAIVWATLLISNILLSGFISPDEMMASAIFMPALALMMALLIPWTTAAQASGPR